MCHASKICHTLSATQYKLKWGGGQQYCNVAVKLVIRGRIIVQVLIDSFLRYIAVKIFSDYIAV